MLPFLMNETGVPLSSLQDLVTLNFMQEKKEADFRYGLVRVRENAESIAFYGGEENELQLLLQRFNSAFENLTVWILFDGSYFFFLPSCIIVSMLLFYLPRSHSLIYFPALGSTFLKFS